MSGTGDATPLSVPAFERRLADLTADQFGQFVADLWAARGAEVVVEGSELRVSLDSMERPQRLRIVPLSGPWPPTSGSSIAEADLGSVDMVVTNADSDRLRTVAAASDTDYVGPGRLRTIALYAVDRKRCEALFERHFGRSVAERQSRETPSERLQWMVEAMGSELREWEARVTPSDSPGWVRGFVTAVVVLAILWVGLTVGSVGHERATAAAFDGDSTVVNSTAVPPSYPPGLAPTGIENRAVLVDSHRAALAGGAYQLTITHRHARGILLPSEWRYTARQHVTVTDDGLQYSVAGSVPPATFGDEPRPFAGTARVDDTGCTARMDNGSRIGVDDGGLCRTLTANGTTPFPRVTGQALTRYLGASASVVGHTDRYGRTYYRVVTETPPEGLPDSVTAYRATADITESGLVTRLAVTYETTWTTTTDPTTFSFRVRENRSSPRATRSGAASAGSTTTWPADN